MKEARPFVFQYAVKAYEDGTSQRLTDETEASHIANRIIQGDNLLALNSLKKQLLSQPESKRIKCIYIDPPYNTGKAFEHYEDNLEVSTWLTMMRDRISILRELLRSDGILYVQLDEKFIFHLKVMLDDIFGRENFVNLFTIKTSDPSGFKTVNPSPYDCAEYVLMYARSKSDYSYETIHVPSGHDFGYSQYIDNIEADYSEWNPVGLNQFIAEREGFENTRAAKKELGSVVFDTMVSEFAIEHCEKVFQGTAIGNDAGADMISLREASKKRKGQILKLERESGQVEYALNGRQVYFYSRKVKEIDGNKTPTKQLTNIWSDIPYNGISGEGNVSFSESKKPEKLIERLLKVANVQKGDFVLDSFSGSGTTVAVAHKMGLNYLGVELGEHCESLIVPRLTDIIENNDTTGISSSISWSGGGSFAFYKLGESIIKTDSSTGKGEFNWSLGKKFIQDSLLISYDFILDEDIVVEDLSMFEKNTISSVGRLTGANGKSIYGIADLAAPEENDLSITNDQLRAVYHSLKSLPDFHSLVIYTNKGIDIAQDSIPGDLDVIKVPHAIFAELER